MKINDYGLVRVAAIAPQVKVADCAYNLNEIKRAVERAAAKQVQLALFPELSLTSSSCGDLFLQQTLQLESQRALLELVAFMEKYPAMITIVGLPLVLGSRLYNVAAVVSHQGILGIVPKIGLSCDNESNDPRWFSEPELITEQFVLLGDEQVLIHKSGIIFRTPYFSFAVEVGESMWSTLSQSSQLALLGAEVLLNPFAKGELVGAADSRRLNALSWSSRHGVAVVQSGAGVGESTTDSVYAGDTLIVENGELLAEGERFSLDTAMAVADIDIQQLRGEQLRRRVAHAANTAAVVVECDISQVVVDQVYRRVKAHPFLPDAAEENKTLNDVFNIQVHGLVKRLKHTNIQKVTIGVSGGLDSTLALLVVARAFDLLGLPRKNIIGITMPGFGTTSRTYSNAVKLMESLEVTIKEISIVASVTQHLEDIEHSLHQHDITYENAQARERTQILMDYANKIGGMVIGTGNMSELALGWATYNGDHMSMYAVNAAIPKTLVSTLTRWIALNHSDQQAKEVLLDIVDTPFSPELLPADEKGEIAQETEHFVGPYELHDFFIHRILRYGDEPQRVLFLARVAFENKYSEEELRHWLEVFYRRFFSQQFKRSCMPDSPRVGTVSLSPRGAWVMPSDAVVQSWLNALKQ